MYISNLIVEVTRKCNMTCEHCLRGNAQRKEISDQTLDTFFSRIKMANIGILTITGGEPSLAVDRIEKTLELLKKHLITVGSFYIATNLLSVPDEFIQVIIKLYLYCDDNELSSVQYSNDVFHEFIPEENIKKISILKFASPRQEERTYNYNNLISEGRAKENGIGVKKTSIDYTIEASRDSVIDPNDYVSVQDDMISECEIYLNCNGKILSCCDLSYKSQSRKKYIICDASEFTVKAVWDYWNNMSKGIK